MSDKTSKRKKYFPNNLRVLRQAPSEMFPSVTFEEFMDWRVGGWELPDGIECVIRARHKETYKVKEYVYQLAEYARRRVDRLMDAGDYDITIATHDAVHHIYNEPSEDYYSDDDE
jgi:hypothetical protein